PPVSPSPPEPSAPAAPAGLSAPRLYDEALYQPSAQPAASVRLSPRSARHTTTDRRSTSSEQNINGRENPFGAFHNGKRCCDGQISFSLGRSSVHWIDPPSRA